MRLLTVLANWIPDPTPDFGTSPTPFIVLMVIGFVVGVAGHLVKSKGTVALGIGLIFLGTLVLPFITYLGKSG
ncbi:MAG: hypothetical protein U0R70_04780 [Solirubrobacteraceae bacterium]